ncbi:hypothetical protein M2R28_16305 [Aeromonas hydrophila]|uniref:hypothetical protein n=1 Tax=Aeromonas hydrophila TaxID=644 RepID=UPI00208E1C43|nr:hypothetical protein [Aeromonas hydrophila]MCO4201229.1 hypothetical protein [Aeromonas hydrophila]
MPKFIFKSTLPEFITTTFVCDYEDDDPSTLKFSSNENAKCYTDMLNGEIIIAVRGQVFINNPKTGKKINRECIKRIVDIVDGKFKSKTENTLLSVGIR